MLARNDRTPAPPPTLTSKHVPPQPEPEFDYMAEFTAIDAQFDTDVERKETEDDASKLAVEQVE
jgi:hypothetical protein